MLAKALAGRRTPLKAALLDQRIVAGLGNIYVCEALHRAGLSPRRRSDTLVRGADQPTERLEALWEACCEVLNEAIRAGDQRSPISVVLRVISATFRTNSGCTIAKGNRVQGKVDGSVARRFNGSFSPVVRPSFAPPVSAEPAHLAQASAQPAWRELATIQHDAAPNCNQSPVEEMPYTKTLTSSMHWPWFVPTIRNSSPRISVSWWTRERASLFVQHVKHSCPQHERSSRYMPHPR